MREMTCIGCPMGCALKAEDRGDEILVSGNQCKRGEKYARSEIRNPVRSVTSTVRILGGTIPRLSVRTDRDVPKDKIFACMEEIRKYTAQAPVRIGDVLIENCAGTGVSIVATKNIGESASS